jgi:hypothetical protein
VRRCLCGRRRQRKKDTVQVERRVSIRLSSPCQRRHRQHAGALHKNLRRQRLIRYVVESCDGSSIESRITRDQCTRDLPKLATSTCALQRTRNSNAAWKDWMDAGRYQGEANQDLRGHHQLDTNPNRHRDKFFFLGTNFNTDLHSFIGRKVELHLS